MAKKKKQQKATKEPATKVILMKDAETDDEEIDAEDEDAGGMYLDKESVQIIYNALSHYAPTPDEENVYGVLHEEFEEMLVLEYGVRLPGFEFMDEEEN
jgi:hypothetical protein